MREYATQMEAAKKGILTPEMKAVAEKEYMDPEKLRQLVALGQIAIPANINHKSLNPEGIGKGLRTKSTSTWASPGTPTTTRRRWTRSAWLWTLELRPSWTCPTMARPTPSAGS